MFILHILYLQSPLGLQSNSSHRRCWRNLYNHGWFKSFADLHCSGFWRKWSGSFPVEIFVFFDNIYINNLKRVNAFALFDLCVSFLPSVLVVYVVRRRRKLSLIQTRFLKKYFKTYKQVVGKFALRGFGGAVVRVSGASVLMGPRWRSG